MQLRLILIGAAWLGLASGAAWAGPPAAAERVADSSGASVGVLVMAHGGDAQWNEAVERTVAPLRARYPIEIAFGMAQSATMQAAVARLEAQGVERIAVVRMFISGESFLEDTEVILGLREPAHGQGHGGAHGDGHDGHDMAPARPIESGASFVVSAEGVAASALVDEVLAARVRALSVDAPAECVLVLAHGPGDDEEDARWRAAMRGRAEGLRSAGPFADIRVETLREDWPEKRADAEARIRAYVAERTAEGKRVIVVPFRVAGFGPYARVLEGLEYASDGQGFCPHPLMTEWIDRTARALAPELP